MVARLLRVTDIFARRQQTRRSTWRFLKTPRSTWNS
jgi:hypothetical protein